MKKRYKILIWIFIILLIIFIAANITIGVIAPKIVESQIESNLGVKAALGKISLTPPFTINLEKLEIGNLASIKKISLTPDLIGLLFGKVIIHGLNVVEPVINIEQAKDGKLNLPVPRQGGKAPAVYLTSIRVENGKLIFTDRKIRAEGFQVILDKINVRVAKVYMPLTSLATDFKVSAILNDAQGNTFGSINFSGWLDYIAKDMDAKLDVQNLNMANFSSYYGNFISNRQISSAILNLNSVFKSKNNDLKIITDFNLSKIIYDQSQSALSQPIFELANSTLDLFTDEKGELKLQFEVDTKMDNPSISRDKLMNIILKAAMKNVSSRSPEQIVDKVTSTIEKYKDIGKELKNIFGN